MTQIINATEAQLEELKVRGVLDVAAAAVLGIEVPEAREGFEVVYAQVASKKAGTVVVVTEVPTMDTLVAAAEGASYIVDCVRTKLLNKTAGIVRNGSDNYPVSIDDFIKARASSAIGGGFLAPFKAIAKDVCLLLRSKGLTIDVTSLRRSMESSQYAQAMYPSLQQSVWDNLLEKLADKANKVEDGSGDLFLEWAEKRYETKEVTDIDIDLSGLV